MANRFWFSRHTFNTQEKWLKIKTKTEIREFKRNVRSFYIDGLEPNAQQFLWTNPMCSVESNKWMPACQSPSNNCPNDWLNCCSDNFDTDQEFASISQKEKKNVNQSDQICLLASPTPIDRSSMCRQEGAAVIKAANSTVYFSRIKSTILLGHTAHTITHLYGSLANTLTVTQSHTHWTATIAKTQMFRVRTLHTVKSYRIHSCVCRKNDFVSMAFLVFRLCTLLLTHDHAYEDTHADCMPASPMDPQARAHSHNTHHRCHRIASDHISYAASVYRINSIESVCFCSFVFRIVASKFV